ncbi:hypothetical protein RJB77_06575, partial [Staphylococcus hominis]
VTAQRAENNQKNYIKDNFYIISIEIVFFHLSRYFMSRTLSIYPSQIRLFIIYHEVFFLTTANNCKFIIKFIFIS